jgi:hypothetical protein
LKNWSGIAGFVDGPRPAVVLSKHGLTDDEVFRLRSDFLAASSDLIACILSIKMMHIYFRLGEETLDYRPHRGPFSGLVSADYRPGKTDRAEALIRLTAEELARLREYAANITRSPSAVLGKPHPLQFREPDFTVRDHRTVGRLDANSLLDSNLRHNCLTWFTTAPIGDRATPLWKLLGMSESDLLNEAHSYIVPFHRYLAESAPAERVPGIVLWTSAPLAETMDRVRHDPKYLSEFYSSPAAAPVAARVVGA